MIFNFESTGRPTSIIRCDIYIIGIRLHFFLSTVTNSKDLDNQKRIQLRLIGRITVINAVDSELKRILPSTCGTWRVCKAGVTPIQDNSCSRSLSLLLKSYLARTGFRFSWLWPRGIGQRKACNHEKPKRKTTLKIAREVANNPDSVVTCLWISDAGIVLLCAIKNQWSIKCNVEKHSAVQIKASKHGAGKFESLSLGDISCVGCIFCIR